MSSLIDSSNKNKYVPQIKNNNLLFDLAKINCQIIFINKENDFTFYENFKRLLSTQINLISSPLMEETKTFYYIKYYEGNKIEKDSFSELVINKNMCIRLYVTQDDISLRQKLIDLYHHDIDALNDPTMIKRSRFIFLFDNKLQNEKESANDKNVYYINKGKNSILLEMRVIITDIVINGYVNYINENTTFNALIDYKKNIQIVTKRVGELIHAQKLEEALARIDKAIKEFNNVEYANFLEIKALCLFYMDYKKKLNGDILKINKEILDLFQSAINKYKKLKTKKLLIEAYLRLLFYCSYFKWGNLQFIQENVLNLVKVVTENRNNYIEIFVNFLKISEIFKNIKLFRKANQFYLFAFFTCYYDDNLSSMIPSMIEEMTKFFYVYNISNNLIESYNDFIKIHKYLILNSRKPICTFLLNKEKNEFELTTKRKFDKSHTINIKNCLKQISHYIFLFFWKNIQEILNDKIIAYYKNNNNNEKKIMYSLGYIQSLYDLIKQKIQKEFFESHIEESLNFQGKIYVNLYKIPLLIKLIPLTSKIKFDIIVNKKKKKNDDSNKIFLYNPWEGKSQTNYFWTSNSFQRIKIELFNPLKIPIEITKIRVLFKGIQPFSYPFNIKLEPNSIFPIIAKIKPNISGITNIIGIQYEIINSVAIQYVDNNGNGLFYQYENYIDESYIGDEKEKVNLNNIMIYPEIAELSYKVLDNSFDIINSNLLLYDYQYYTFSFLLKNKGKYQIDKIHCYIYTYKKNNYKISLDEIKQDVIIKPGENYIFNYKYWHREIYVKIDFKIFYISNEKEFISENEDDYLMKPYLFYSKKLQTLHLIDFINKNIIPVLSTNDCLILSKIDNRINKNSSKEFCNEANCFTLTIQNINESPIKIEFYDIEQDKIIRKEECDGYKFKEISCVVNSKVNYDNVILRWVFTDLEHISGKIELKQIYSDLIYSLFSPFSFEIKYQILNDQLENQYVNCEYIIKNNKNKVVKNLKIMIYLYQNIDDVENYEDYIFNYDLNQNVFTEGSLTFYIDKIEPNNKLCYDIKIYPNKNETLFTTFSIIDLKNNDLFLCPFSKSFTI
jgi:hypothetical protein